MGPHARRLFTDLATLGYCNAYARVTQPNEAWFQRNLAKRRSRLANCEGVPQEQLTYWCAIAESRASMHRFIAFLVLWAGLLGVGSPAFACAAAASAGDCCPPGAPSGCTQALEQLDIEATVCCITAAAPSQMVSAERGRELQAVQDDCRSADPIAIVSTSSALPDPGSSPRLTVSSLSSARTDARLTYLRTGRLRL
jgi:hypothetical protein